MLGEFVRQASLVDIHFQEVSFAFEKLRQRRNHLLEDCFRHDGRFI